MHSLPVWFIAALPSTARKGSYEQSTVISELLLQRASRKKGAWSEEEQKGSQLSKFSWRLSEKEAIAVIFFFFPLLWNNQTTTKDPSVELDSCKATKLVSVRNGEDWLLRKEGEAPRAEIPGAVSICSQYLIPVLQYIKSKVVQLSIFQRIVTKKESSKIKALQAQTRDWVSEREHLLKKKSVK